MCYPIAAAMETNSSAPVKTIHELKQEQARKIDELFKACGVFFAFSAEQFERNKTPLQEGEKYVSMGAGGYVPRSKARAVADGLERIRKEFNAAVNANRKQRRALIVYELNNHEALYTGDISDALEALGKGYTAQEVRKVYNELAAQG